MLTRSLAWGATLTVAGALVVTLGPVDFARADGSLQDPTPAATATTDPAPVPATDPTISASAPTDPAPVADPTTSSSAPSDPGTVVDPGTPTADPVVSPAPVTDTTPVPTTPTKAEIARAKALIAVRAAKSRVRTGQYVRGRSGPNAFDCSGLMIYAYRKVGVKLPHSSRAMSLRGKKVAKKDLRPGDLVFFYTPVHHVGMYIGNGLFVHARNPRDDLEITRLSKYPHYRWARRVLG